MTVEGQTAGMCLTMGGIVGNGKLSTILLMAVGMVMIDKLLMTDNTSKIARRH